MSRFLFLVIGMLSLFRMDFAEAAGDAQRGGLLYKQMCAGCHSIDYNGIGPAHKGVFNRKAGSAEGYAYSSALKASGMVWNEQTLDRWLANPERLVPGQKMGFMVRSAKDRADLIAYLKTVSGESDAGAKK
jgi:cytochrome c